MVNGEKYGLENFYEPNQDLTLGQYKFSHIYFGPLGEVRTNIYVLLFISVLLTCACIYFFKKIKRKKREQENRTNSNHCVVE